MGSLFLNSFLPKCDRKSIGRQPADTTRAFDFHEESVAHVFVMRCVEILNLGGVILSSN